MKKAYSYIRFSSKQQAAGDSLRRQTEAAQLYCDRHELILDASLKLADLGVSAFTGDNLTHGKLGAFIQAIDDKHVARGSTLILESLDRMSRQEILDSLELFLGIVRRGITIVTLDPEEVFERANLDPMRLMSAIMVMARAHEESATKSTRITAAHRASIEDARTTKKAWHGRPPIWIEKIDGQWVIDPVAGGIVKRMVKMAMSGLGAPAIAKTLNREKIATIGRGSSWGQSTINRVLRSVGLFGQYQPTVKDPDHAYKRIPSGDPINGYYPALISEKQFFQLQSKIKSRVIPGKRTGPKMHYLLSGLMKSGQDGSSMVVDRGGRADSFRLISSDSKKGLSSTGGINYRVIETQLLFWLTEVDLDGQKEEDNNTDELTGRLADIQDKIKKVETQIDESSDFDRLLTLLAKLSADENKIRDALDVARSKQMRTPIATSRKKINEVAGRLAELDRNEREKLAANIANVVDHIEVWTFGSNPVTRAAFFVAHFADGSKRVMACRTKRGHKPVALHVVLDVDRIDNMHFDKAGQYLLKQYNPDDQKDNDRLTLHLYDLAFNERIFTN